MTNRESYANKIEILKGYERLEFDNGVIIGEGKTRLFYSKVTGAVKSVRLYEEGWRVFGSGACCSTTAYMYSMIPGTRIQLPSHVIAAVCLGLFDGKSGLVYMVNHKNYKKTDNRPENLELVTGSENSLHSVFKQMIKAAGLWVMDFSIEAKQAIELINRWGRDAVMLYFSLVFDIMLYNKLQY